MKLNKAEQDLKKLQKAYKEIFGGLAGEKVLADLIQTFYIFKPTPVNGIDNMIHALHTEGQREVVQYILEMAKCSPADLVTSLFVREE